MLRIFERAELQMDAQLYFPREQEFRIFDLSRDTRILKKEAASECT